MHFGVLSIFQNYHDEHSDSEIVEGELALARLAEDAGFDSYWAVEHHFFSYSMCPDNLQFLAQVAGFTERIKLGTACRESLCLGAASCWRVCRNKRRSPIRCRRRSLVPSPRAIHPP